MNTVAILVEIHEIAKRNRVVVPAESTIYRCIDEEKRNLFCGF
jgi:hypothetical protein